MIKFDPISQSIFAMILAFFCLLACESRPVKKSFRTKKITKVSVAKDYTQKNWQEIDLELTQKVNDKWDNFLGAKAGYSLIESEIQGLELVRQLDRFKLHLTSTTAGLCVFQGFYDDNRQGLKWIKAEGERAHCENFQARISKQGHRYHFQLKGFAGFQIPVDGIILERDYGSKELFGYSVQSYQQKFDEFGENYISQFLQKGPMNMRVIKVYLPTELQSDPIKGFSLIHNFFSYFSNETYQEKSVNWINWAIEVDLNSRSMASQDWKKAKAKKLQLHYFEKDLMDMVDSGDKLWMKIGANRFFNAVMVFHPNK